MQTYPVANFELYLALAAAIACSAKEAHLPGARILAPNS
jgi:hypothetical protein